MYIVFYSTSDVFRAEALLNDNNIDCKVVPTPVQDKAYCGVCVETNDTKCVCHLVDMDYKTLD